MILRKFIKKSAVIALSALIAMSIPLSNLENISASADSSSDFSPTASHNGEKGIYHYHFEGKLTNPCNESVINDKSDVINEFWFDFTYIEDNGLGEKRTERFDMSYSNGSNNHMDFVKANFLRPNDDETDLSFDMNIPGQLTKMDIHLDMNGSVNLFSYERMSFEIKTVKVNGIKVNSSSDKVSSTVGSSDASISFHMEKPDSKQLAQALNREEITNAQILKLIDERTIEEKNITDKYGALLTEKSITNLVENYDSEINQTFSHSDEQGMYHYTLKMQIDNPVNISGTDAHRIEKFIIDFTYNENEHYELDMSWDPSEERCKNAAFADLFCRTNDKESKSDLDIWIPGKVNRIDVTLNMSDGDRLGVTFIDVLLGGMKVNRSTDYVSSVSLTSKAEIDCIVPDSLIDLSQLSDERVKEVLDVIYSADGQADLSDVRDQFGSVIGKEQFDAAHEDMIKCINASDNDPRAEYAGVVTGFYMYKTVHHAESVSVLQSFIEEKRMKVQTIG